MGPLILQLRQRGRHRSTDRVQSLVAVFMPRVSDCLFVTETSKVVMLNHDIRRRGTVLMQF